MNLYPETVESGLGKSRMALYGTPGLTIRTLMPTTPNRGLFSYQDIARNDTGPRDRLWIAAGGYFYEMQIDWTVFDPVIDPLQVPAFEPGDDTGTVQFACNGQQICIATGKRLYCYDLTANTLTPLNFTIHNADGTTSVGDPIVASDVEEIDGFFFALITNTNQFNASALYDGTDWDPLDYAMKTGSSDIAVGLASDHGQLWVMGSETAETWGDAGNPSFPLGRNQSGFMQRGLASLESLIEFDDGIFWLGQESDGGVIAYRNSGYNAVRVSNHSVETAMNGYPTTNDAISSSYVEEGHHFWLLHFPSANGGDGATWCYDTSTSMWHERGFFTNGKYIAFLGRYHAFAFGKHVVADWRTEIGNGAGNIYQQSLDYVVDRVRVTGGDIDVLIRRLRRGPPVSLNMNWTFFQEFQLDMQMGQGVPDAGTPFAGLPNFMVAYAVLRFSDDGGYTWSNEIWTQLGSTGQYSARAMWRRLGKSRDRVFEVVIAQPIQICLIAAYLRMLPGSGA